MLSTAAVLLHKVVEVAEPWRSLYADSTVVSTTVLSAHLGGMLIGGGLAVSTDRMTFRRWRADAAERARHLEELGGTHRTVLAALGIVFATGLLLFLSDVEEFAGSLFFWIKLTLVALLLVNGWMMTRTESALRASTAGGGAERLWRRLRLAAATSAALWLATLLAGVALMNA